MTQRQAPLVSDRTDVNDRLRRDTAVIGCWPRVRNPPRLALEMGCSVWPQCAHYQPVAPPVSPANVDPKGTRTSQGLPNAAVTKLAARGTNEGLNVSNM